MSRCIRFRAKLPQKEASRNRIISQKITEQKYSRLIQCARTWQPKKNKYKRVLAKY